ncbi:hypothetical protein ACLKA6_017872 [Drosophila palustris]
MDNKPLQNKGDQHEGVTQNGDLCSPDQVSRLHCIWSPHFYRGNPTPLHLGVNNANCRVSATLVTLTVIGELGKPPTLSLDWLHSESVCPSVRGLSSEVDGLSVLLIVQTTLQTLTIIVAIMGEYHCL